jgi:hypothetical protein
MTYEEHCLLKKNSYSFYTGNMGKVFNDWHDKKIDGTKAIQLLKGWYNKGLEEIKKENCADTDINQNEMKRHYDSLDSYIRKYDLINDEELTLTANMSIIQFYNLVNVFPKFKDDYPILKENSYLHETEEGLRWLKTKQCLAEYFYSISTPLKKMSWKQLETIFCVDDLKNSLSSNGSPFKKKSKDFEHWEKIRNTPKGK